MTARLTTASLRPDLANYKAEVQRQRGEISALLERLSEALRARYTAGLPEGARLELSASRDTRGIAELEQRAFKLGEELARKGEELRPSASSTWSCSWPR